MINMKIQFLRNQKLTRPFVKITYKINKEISEDILHRSCVEWFDEQYSCNEKCWRHHSPNENARGTSFGYNNKMRKLGTITGEPDLQIGFEGKIIYIEFKKNIKNAKLTAAQETRMKQLQKSGFDVFIVKTQKQFEEIIYNFIK